MSNDAIVITSDVKNQPGYYEAYFSTEQWEAGITISFNFMGANIGIEKPPSRITSDYYLKLKSTNEFIYAY